MWIIGVVFGILGLVAFGLRVMARVFVGTHKTWGPDDWVMTIAVVSTHFCLVFCKDRLLTAIGLDDTSCSSICPSYVFGHQWIS